MNGRFLPSNRTKVELKLVLQMLPIAELRSSNRTKVELKHYQQKRAPLDADYQLLTEPRWN